MYRTDSRDARPPSRGVFRAPANEHSPVGRRPDLRIPVVVLADAPVIALGLGELVKRTHAVDVTATTTHLSVATHLVRAGGARVVLVSSAATAPEDTGWALSCLQGLQAAARAADRKVGTVCIASSATPAAVRSLREWCSTVLTTEDGSAGLGRAIRAARASRLSRSDSDRVRAGRLDPRPTGAADGRAPLTPRELDVLQGLVNGLSSKHIAQQLGLSVNTVRTHVQRVLPKLGAHTRLRAIAIALEEGLVDPRPSAVLSATR